MASYKISVKKSAEKELRAILGPYLKKIVKKIDNLSVNQRPAGCEMLAGEERYFRIRQGDYRIVYDVNDASREVTIVKIGHRREVYR